MTLGTRPSQRLTLAVACMAQGMMVLDVLIVSVALPAMQRELHLSPAGLEWTVSGYALALAALIPTGGALGDHFGRKRIFVSGVTLFTLASVGCALSVSGAMLVGFRVIHGIGAVRCRDGGRLPGRGQGVPGAGTPLLRLPGGRAECVWLAAADLRVRRIL